jgi:hypothetical protein
MRRNLRSSARTHRGFVINAALQPLRRWVSSWPNPARSGASSSSGINTGGTSETASGLTRRVLQRGLSRADMRLTGQNTAVEPTQESRRPRARRSGHFGQVRFRSRGSGDRAKKPRGSQQTSRSSQGRAGNATSRATSATKESGSITCPVRNITTVPGFPPAGVSGGSAPSRRRETQIGDGLED